MPAVTRWVLRTALLWAIVATATGVMLVWPGSPAFPYPTYLHLFMVGWLSNLIFGVAHWMFPRASATQPRGDARLAWMGWGLLNIGLLFRVVGEALRPVAMDRWLLISAAVQFVAVLFWVAHLWPRVKER
jgi:hypothetical protein